MSLGRLGSFEILECVGRGGMGVVFRARDTRPERLDREVALKVLAEPLASDPGFRARLLREARAEASLNHPNIATCFEVGEGAPEPADLLDPGGAGPHPERVPYLAMEYVPGEDLEALVMREPLPIARVVDLALQITAGLEAAHRAGVVHRDLKPSNVRLMPSGVAKILDFGVARVRASTTATDTTGSTLSMESSAGRLLGTVPYMSPEQAQGGPVDARSDLFSLGVTLYRLATGHLPFEGHTTVEVLFAIANAEPQPLARYAAEVPDELQRIVRKLLAKRPGDRYQSAHEVATDLAALRDRLAGGPRASRRPARALAVALAVLAAVAVTAWALVRLGLPPFARPHNVVVLPFADSTGDSTLAHVGVGLADEVRGTLARRAGIDVASGEAARQAAGETHSPRALARALGVGSFLTGVLRRQEGLTQLAVELVDTRSGFVLWSADYPWTFADALRIRRDIVEGVMGRLSARPRPGSGHEEAAPTSSPGAYETYLKGLRMLDDPDDPLGPDRASELFGRALAQDPEFALAWAGRSRALYRMYARDRSPETLRSAEQAALEAGRLAPDVLEGHIALAQIYRGTGRFAAAVAQLQQVLRVNPRLDEAHLQLAATYRDAGQLALAERSVRRAVELRPDYWRTWNSLGSILLRRGDRAGARQAFEHLVALAPGMDLGYEQLAALDQLEGRYEDALAEYRRLPAPVRDATLASNIASLYMTVGRLPEARDYLVRAVQLAPENPTYRENLGDLQMRAGREGEARADYAEGLRLTERALRVDPGMADLRVQHALYHAKAGGCTEAAEALSALDPRLLEDSPEAIYAAAKIDALCGKRASALARLRRALAHGIAHERPRDEVEFRSLATDAEFVRLVGSAGPASAATTGPP